MPYREPGRVSAEEFLEAAKSSPSVRGVIRNAGIRPTSHDASIRRMKKLGVYDEVRSLVGNGGRNDGGSATFAVRGYAKLSGRTENRPYPVPDIVGTTATVEPDVERIRKHAEERFAAKAKRSEQKKHQRIRFGHGPVALFYVGDEHLGNAGTDVARVFDEQAQIMATPGSYVVAVGDSVDNMIIGKLLAEQMKPGLSVWESWELARHYFAGYKDRMLAHIGGNHNGWSLKLSGIDYSRDITPGGVLYDSDEIRMTVHVGHHEFRIRSRHKYPGNSIYNPTHGLERAARFDTPDFDIFTGAHVHKGAMAREFNLNGRRKIALLSGTFKTEDDYGREIGFAGNDGSTACGLVLEDDGTFWASASISSIRRYMKAVYRG